MRFGESLRSLVRRVPLSVAALAVVAYVPLLLTHRGMVGADTKTYLYLNPGRLLSRAPYLWDPGVGLGTVTHQNIGYLWPMGPYYAVMDWLGFPDWIAQRLWLGSLIFLAGLGVRALLRTLRWDGPGIGLASFAYALSPYLLHYVYKHSVILLPFVALPWLIHFAARALRRGGWRDPAAFALVTVTAGGVNATSLLLVMVGPVLWVLHAWWNEHEVRWPRVLTTAAKIGLLTLVTSLWWMAGLTLQGENGINILRYTETYKTVADASSATEVFRGFGYWFFYGTDILGPWFRAAVTYTQSLPALALSFAVPILAVAGNLLTRFRHQAFFVAMAAAGLVLSVGSHPWDDPSPYGDLYQSFATTDAGLAMRSTPRAIPLLALSLAVFGAAGMSVLIRVVPRWRWATIGIAYLLVVANLSPLWMGRMIDEFLERPEHVPAWWEQAGDHLDAGDRSTRALEVPGIEFANYRWGSTVDPVTPGLTDRDFWARELVPWGSPASADLTNAIDAGFADGSFDPDGFVPLLRLTGVGDVVARNDLEYERYRTPRPREMADWLGRAGLEGPTTFGPAEPNRAAPERPLLDDLEAGIPPDVGDPHPVEIWGVPNALPVVRTVPAAEPVVMSGNGAGVVALADAGLLDPQRLLVYSATASDSPARVDRLLDDGAALVVTDTNRRAARRWGAVRENDGYTERADEEPREDVSDNRLPVFGARSDDPDTQTVAVPRGEWIVAASDYGNDLTYTPGDRPFLAVDGDVRTAWKVGAFSDVVGDWIELRRPEGATAVTTDHVRLVQPPTNVNRWITRATLSFDGGDEVEVDLDGSSRTAEGQTISFDPRTFSSLRITIEGTEPGRLRSYRGISGVGFAEVDVDGLTATEFIRPPVDLVDAVGDRAGEHSMQWVLTRRRSNPAEGGLAPEERVMRRLLTTPVARTVTVSGSGRLDPSLTDDRIDALLGVPDATAGGLTMTSSSRPVGDLYSRAAKALDGDTATAWQSRLNPGPGDEWWQVTFPRPRTVTLGGLDVLDDRAHSLPAAFHLEVDGRVGPTIRPGGGGEPGDDGSITTLTFDPVSVTGTNVRLVVDEITPRTAPDWLSGRPTTMPLGLAEIPLQSADAGDGQLVRAPTPPGELAPRAVQVPVQIGGSRLPYCLSGTTADAERGHQLDLAACGSTPGSAALVAGDNDVVTADGEDAGVTVDQLVLSAAPTAGSPAAATAGSGAAVGGAPPLDVHRTSRVGYDVEAGPSDAPYWLVLGQSINDGWRLTADGHDLGEPSLINGFANGWRIDPAEVGPGPLTLQLTWTPQRIVWIALALSVLGVLACLALVAIPALAGSRSEARPPIRPTGIDPFGSFGEPAGLRATIGWSVLVGGLTLIFVGPLWALPVAALTAAALRTRWGWPAVRVACLGLLGLTAAFVVARQWRNDLLVDFDWPQQFEAVARLPLVAFALLVVDAVVEAVRAGWRRQAGM